ncbi:uncharacterized protein N0V89_006912 [Didymosphaeria variabile]|uniref:Uncharacterized protein n=1 Tax=Didymosphaeria variabile TaxID=1932322 RepID=A0A9W8XIH1_9PLEO|nr:uncharacterized protein N0V89_006912 [Didymosphaeria variabile]KAJ4351569.1 hypothetical protein N0V89_006912 [Didymosphaeria variabile]
MIAIRSTNAKKCTPNLLPARLNHNGPVNDTNHYWKPETDQKGTPHAYFRGRHLHGTPLALPSTHTGAILQVTDENLPQPRPQAIDEEDGEDEQETAEVKIAERIGDFDEVVVWGHGGEVEGEQDMFIRGVKEWMGFAEAMHGEEEDGEGKDGMKGS